ncbi:S-layer homology domain-containing protein [Paenibacillus sp. strain BS8-2]
MKKTMKWMIALSLFVSVFAGGANVANAESGATNELPFSDISKHWAKDTILQAYNAGFVEGFEDGTFRPDDVVKADQFIVMMLRAHSVTTNDKTVFDPAWYAELEEEQPGFLNMIQNAVLLKKFNFTNAKTGYWAAPYVDFIYEMGFIPSFDPIFPQDHKKFQQQLKREGSAYLLSKWYSVYENRLDAKYMEFARSQIGLKDLKDFSYGGNSTITTMLLSGIMNGYPNQHFYPQRYVTRAEALTMILRLRDTSLRLPFKPNLKGQYYTENGGNIYLFNNKIDYDYYIKLLDAAKKHVSKGYTNISNTGIAVFTNQEVYEKYNYFTRTGQFDLRPDDEMFVVVDTDYRELEFSYPVTSTFKTSNDFVSSIYEIMAGTGKGKELRSKVEALTKESMGKDFTFNGKNFKYYVSGKRFAVKLMY